MLKTLIETGSHIHLSQYHMIANPSSQLVQQCVSSESTQIQVI